MKIESVGIGMPNEIAELLKMPSEMSFLDRYIKLLFAVSSSIMGILLICLISCCFIKCGRKKGEGWRWYQSGGGSYGKSFYHQDQNVIATKQTSFNTLGYPAPHHDSSFISNHSNWLNTAAPVDDDDCQSSTSSFPSYAELIPNNGLDTFRIPHHAAAADRQTQYNPSTENQQPQQTTMNNVPTSVNACDISFFPERINNTNNQMNNTRDQMSFSNNGTLQMIHGSKMVSGQQSIGSMPAAGNSNFSTFGIPQRK
jgi:hypothetical protein